MMLMAMGPSVDGQERIGRPLRDPGVAGHASDSDDVLDMIWN